MSARTTQEQVEWFTHPSDTNHRRYEALRAVFVDHQDYHQVADRFGYTYWAIANLVRDHKANPLSLFASPAKPGPVKGSAPAKHRARARIIELRREGLSIYEISARLAQEGTPLNRTGVSEILREEGFGRLLRHPQPIASINPATPGRSTQLRKAGPLNINDLPQQATTRHAGLLLLLPDLIDMGLVDAVTNAGYPGTRGIEPLNWILSLLALKLTGLRRVSHVDDLLGDPAVALFAGLSALPKKTALTNYSYRTSRAHQLGLLTGLAPALLTSHTDPHETIFDLDFHSIMHWGNDPVLEKNYVPTRSQRARSVLTFLAQDRATSTLVYSNADCWQATQAREVIEFCDYWKTATGHDPTTLVMDQKVTTHTTLAELDQRGITFLTLRMRSAALLRHIASLTPNDYTRVTLNRTGPHNHPLVHDEHHVRIHGYTRDEGVRQLIIHGLGRDQPTVIITNDTRSTPRQIISRYAQRATIEQRLAENIKAFNTDALSSAVNLNVDLDLALCVLAHAATTHLAHRLPGYTTKTPAIIQQRFLQTPGTITRHDNHITVTLNHRAYQPVLRQADLPNTPIPWWDGYPLHYQLA